MFIVKHKGPRMEQLHLPTVDLTLNVAAFIGHTDWALASMNPPPSTGWWETRRKSSPNLLQPQRRWYDGKVFSAPVLLGCGDDDAEDLASTPASVQADDIEWRGLKEPWPQGYPYRIIYFNKERV